MYFQNHSSILEILFMTIHCTYVLLSLNLRNEQYCGFSGFAHKKHPAYLKGAIQHLCMFVLQSFYYVSQLPLDNFAHSTLSKRDPDIIM